MLLVDVFVCVLVFFGDLFVGVVLVLIGSFCFVWFVRR